LLKSVTYTEDIFTGQLFYQAASQFDQGKFTLANALLVLEKGDLAVLRQPG